jgi:hypothetical protein
MLRSPQKIGVFAVFFRHALLESAADLSSRPRFAHGLAKKSSRIQSIF